MSIYCLHKFSTITLNKFEHCTTIATIAPHTADVNLQHKTLVVWPHSKVNWNQNKGTDEKTKHMKTKTTNLLKQKATMKRIVEWYA